MANMRVERQNILEYLSKNTFLIPMYQRPYAWGEDECRQLWEDIVDFYKEGTEDDEYFLGTSVLYQENKKQNLIDGQQRTTTLILLIRALYEKAYEQNNIDKNNNLKGLIRRLGSCLWQMDRDDNPLYDQPKLTSEVAIDSDSEILREILSDKYLNKEKAGIGGNGKQGQYTASKYAENFLFFIKKSNEIAEKYPTKWQEICYAILEKCVILPIECDAQENALRIFNTLNDRGIPLTDSDIFKGVMFSQKKTDEAKKEFAKNWKDMEKELRDSGNQMDFIFLNYMHIVRARQGDRGNVIGLRKFFIEKNREILQDNKTFKEIQELTKYWCGHYDSCLSDKANQFYEVLYGIPNNDWKYLDSAYYFYYGKNKRSEFFENGDLEKFLARVVSNLLVKLIEKPIAVGQIILNAYTSLYEKGVVDFQTNTKQILENKESFKRQFFEANRLIPSLLSLNLFLKYPEQESWLEGEIEHIAPKTMQKGYVGWDQDEAYPCIESIGNKMWLEKIHNIKASNNSFSIKKKEYKKSKFLEAQEMANSSKNDWLKADIEARNEEIFNRLYDFFMKNL